MPPCLILSIIRYVSTVSGAIQGKEYRPPLHLRVVAIEKGDVGSVNLKKTYIRSIWKKQQLCFLLVDFESKRGTFRKKKQILLQPA